MKYTKTALAVAVAAGFAVTPMMAAAETTLSGVLELQVKGTDVDDDDATPDVDESDAADPTVAAGDVRVAIASEHELNSGLIGYGNVQFNLDNLTGEGGAADATVPVAGDPDGEGADLNDRDVVIKGSNATVASDNVYVGVKGGFGDVRIGEIPLGIEYGQFANDIHDVGVTVPGGLSYTGTFGPVGVILNGSPEQNSDMFGAGVKFGFFGASIGLGYEDRADRARYAIGASYAIAGFSIAAHYWASENDFNPDLTDEDGGGVTATGFSIDDSENFAVQVGYTIAGIALGVTYSAYEADEDDLGFAVGDDETVLSNDEAIIRFDAGYDLGGGTTISTRIQNATDNSDQDLDDLLAYRVQLAKVF